MGIHIRLFRRIALGSIAVVLTSLGADTPPQVIDAGGLTFEAPAAWKATKPANTMRRAQMSIEPVKGDEEPAQLVLFAFLGGPAGSMKTSNASAVGSSPRTASSPRSTRRSSKGRTSRSPGLKSPGTTSLRSLREARKRTTSRTLRLLGGIVQTGGTGYFLRVVGPDKTVSAASKGFDELLASMKAEAK